MKISSLEFRCLFIPTRKFLGRLGIFSDNVALVRNRLEVVLLLQFLELFGRDAECLCFSDGRASSPSEPIAALMSSTT